MVETFKMDDGIHVRARTAGDGDLILLVHGLGGAAIDFQDHMGWLGTLGTVAAVDLRGHGESDHPEEESCYGVSRFIADLQDIVASIGKPLRAVIAHSMGGILVQRAVVAGTLTPESLVLVGTCPGPLPGLTPEMARAGAELIRSAGLTTFRHVIDEMDPLGSPASRRYKELHPEHSEIQEWRWQHTAPAMYAAMLHELTTIADISEHLRTVEIPCAVIVGDEDEPFVEPTARIAEAMPNATYTLIPDAGHHPQLHQPEAWMAAVRGGLSRR